MSLLRRDFIRILGGLAGAVMVRGPSELLPAAQKTLESQPIGQDLRLFIDDVLTPVSRLDLSVFDGMAETLLELGQLGCLPRPSQQISILAETTEAPLPQVRRAQIAGEPVHVRIELCSTGDWRVARTPWLRWEGRAYVRGLTTHCGLNDLVGTDVDLALTDEWRER